MMNAPLFRVVFRPIGGLSYSNEWVGVFKKQPFCYCLHEVWRDEFFPTGTSSVHGFCKKTNEHDFNVLFEMLKRVKDENLEIGYKILVRRVIDVRDGAERLGRVIIEHVVVHDVQY